MNFDKLLNSAIVAQDGTFLGIVSKNKFSSDSISNQFGSYGSKFSATSILNRFGSYGSPFSSLSPFNKFSSTPPRLIKNNEIIGFLTLNKFVKGAVDANLVLSWLGLK